MSNQNFGLYVNQRMSVAEMVMLKWMSGVARKYNIKSKYKKWL